MGFWDFLKSFFSGKKAKKTAKKKNNLGLLQAKNYLNELEQKQFSAIEQKIFARFAEIKHLLKEISNELNELSKVNVEEGENKRLRRIVETSRNSAVSQMQRLVERLTPPTRGNLKELKNYCTSCHSLMETEIRHFGRNIAYTGIVLKEQMKSLGEKMNELNTVFIELNQLFQNPMLTGIPAVKEHIEQLDSELMHRKNSVALHNQAMLEIKQLKAKKNEILDEIESKKKSQEAEDLRELIKEREQLNEKKNKVREKIFELMSGVEKPLRRFLQLAEGGQYPLSFEEKELLESYLSNPFNAVKKDIKAEKLKKFLQQLKPLIENETIGLKDKEKEKKLQAINELLSFNFFDNVFWELNKVETQLIELSKKIEKIELNRKLNYLEAEAKRTEKEIEAKQIELVKTKASIEKSSQSLEQLRQKIQQISSQSFGEEIEVGID